MGRNNVEDTLNAIRDESRAVGMKMSTGGVSFGEASLKPTGCFKEVQTGRNHGEDALNALRDESQEIMVMMSTRENSFGEVTAEKCATIDVVGLQMKNKGPEK